MPYILGSVKRPISQTVDARDIVEGLSPMVLIFNETVMPGLYLNVSEMSIVGPPPRHLGGVFFAQIKESPAR